MELKNLSDTVMRRWTDKQIHDDEFNGLSDYPRKIKTIMDIGANLGQSIVSLRILFPDAKIHSFEANPALIENLENLSRKIPGEIEIHPFGLADTNGNFTLNIPYANGIAFIEEASITESYYESPWVKEKFIERGGLTLEKVTCEIKNGDSLGLLPDLIKIDVEGAEHRVLIGLKNTIKKCKPIVMAENSDWHNVTKLMKSYGYTPYRYNKETRKLIPQNGPSINTFYIYNGTAYAITETFIGKLRNKFKSRK